MSKARKLFNPFTDHRRGAASGDVQHYAETVNSREYVRPDLAVSRRIAQEQFGTGVWRNRIDPPYAMAELINYHAEGSVLNKRRYRGRPPHDYGT